MTSLDGRPRKPVVFVLAVVIALNSLIGASWAQRNNWGNNRAYTPPPVYRPDPPRPMVPAPRPMTPQFNNAVRPPALLPNSTRLPSTSGAQNPRTTTGPGTQGNRALPTRLATAPIAQVPSYTGRISTKGTPIVVTKVGATYSIPEKGMFSTKIIQRFQYVRSTLVRQLANGKMAVLQTRITKYASAPQLITTRIASNDNGKGGGSKGGPPTGGGGGGNAGGSGSGGGDGERVAANDNNRRDGKGGAKNINQANALKAQLIGQEIAAGHSFEKHIVKDGDFKNLGIQTREQFAAHIKNVIKNPSDVRYHKDGRTVYLQESSQTVVVINGISGESTAYQSRDWAETISRLPSRNTPK